MVLHLDDSYLSTPQRYYLEHKEEIQKWHKNYYQSHRERILARAKEYAESHKEKINEYAKKRREEHPEFRQQYYLDHKEQENLKSIEYRQNHPKEISAYNRLYRMVHREELKIDKRKWSEANKDKQVAETQAYYRIPLGNECELCGSSKFLERHHPDYAEPLLIVTLCRSCHKIVHMRGNFDTILT